MNHNQKKLRKLVFKSLDTILKFSQETAQKWDKNTVALNYLNELIERAKLKPESETKLNEFVNAFNNVLDTLQKTCKRTAEKMESNLISVETLERYINVIKEEFDKQLT